LGLEERVAIKTIVIVCYNLLQMIRNTPSFSLGSLEQLLQIHITATLLLENAWKILIKGHIF